MQIYRGFLLTTALLISSHTGVIHGGCCTVNLNYCVDKVPEACKKPEILGDFTPNVLYSCLQGRDPIYITQCDFGCLTPANGQAGFCSVDGEIPDTTSVPSPTAAPIPVQVPTPAVTGGTINDDALISVVAKQLRLTDNAVDIMEQNNFITVADLKLVTGDALVALALPIRDALAIRAFLHLPAEKTRECQKGAGSEAPPATTAPRAAPTRRGLTTAKVRTTRPAPDDRRSRPGDSTRPGFLLLFLVVWDDISDIDATEEGASSEAPPGTTAITTRRRPTTQVPTTQSAPDDIVDTAPADSGDASNLDTRSTAVQQIILDVLNGLRRREKAANMLKVMWDPVAARSAQTYVEQCKYTPHKHISSSNFTRCGQNLAMGNGFETWQQVFDSWNEQKGNFIFGQNPCLTPVIKIGAYTQNVWAHSYQIGCAMAACPDIDGPMFTCHYCPQGNFNGKCQPYQQGTPANGGVCGKCGGVGSSSCDDGLCTNPCPYQNLFKECDDIFPDADSCSDPQALNRAGCEATCNCRDAGLIYWID